MLHDKERVLGFGKREALSPAEALRKLYDTDDEVAVVIDGFARRRGEILASGDVLATDRDLLEKLESDAIRKLSEHGIEITEETLEEFLATL